MGKNELAVLDSSGDTKTMWDPDSEVEVKIAQNTFDELKKKGYSIFRVGKDGEKSVRMDVFDKYAGKLIAVPKISGG